MNIHHFAFAWFMAVIAPCVLAMPVVAQQAPSTEPSDDESIERLEQELKPEDPGVAAILATRPTTSLECVRAAKILADLGQPELGRPLLKKVLDANLASEHLAELGDALGPAAVLQLANCEALLPEARQLADAVLAALSAKKEDSQRIAALIQQLQDISADKRYEAMAALQEARRAAVAPLIEVLADPTRGQEYPNVQKTLAGMGRVGRDAVLGSLEDADPALAVQLIPVLAEMKGSDVGIAMLAACLSESGDPGVRGAACNAVRRLLGKIPTRTDAMCLLTDAADNYFSQRQLLDSESEGQVDVWRWDAEKRKCVGRRCDVVDARRALAARWARDAYLIAPENRETQLLHLATLLEAAQYDRGLEQPLEENSTAVVEAKKLGVRLLDDVLARALSGGHVGAAQAAARLLGQLGTADALLYQGTGPAPLVRAVRDANRRVRMAAIQAIIQLKPTKPYPGSSDVPRALKFFAASSGTRRVLAADPILQDARDLGGMLAPHGYQADIAATGKELMKLAASSPDYELVLIDVAIDQPVIDILLQQMRRDERTASLRVGLIARAGFRERAEHAERSDPLSKAFSRPNDDNMVNWQLDQLALLRPREFVDFDTRQRQAAEALDLLAELIRSPHRLYDLRGTEDAVLTALYTPKLSTKAIAVLAEMNSAESQRALIEVASRFTEPLELRAAAADAFCQNSKKHGLLLTTDEISRQYRRYNESETLDADTQRVLGQILDCIELPSRAAAGKNQASDNNQPQPK